MDEISQAALGAMIEELRAIGREHGYHLVSTTELDPVDPECAYAITLMSDELDWTAKFCGATIMSCVRGAADYVRYLIGFNGEPNPQSQPQPE